MHISDIYNIVAVNVRPEIHNIVAANEGPELQGFRRTFLIELDTLEVPEASQTNQMPAELMRRASETATNNILTDLEPESERLLAVKDEPPKPRPQPPPRVHISAKGPYSSTGFNGNGK